MGGSIGLVMESVAHPRSRGPQDTLLVLCPEHLDTITRDGWTKQQLLDLTPAGAPMIIIADGAGAASLTVNNASACGSGLLVQAVDAATCVASNSSAL